MALSLNPDQNNNLVILNNYITQYGVTNQYARTAILSNVLKECALKSVEERTDYSRQSNEEIRRKFRSRLERYSDEQLTRIKNNERLFVEIIYGGVVPTNPPYPSDLPPYPAWGLRNLGNTQPNDGYRYKGRGFIQITGRSNYRRFSTKVGVDLENNPEAALQIDTAAKIAVQFLIEGCGLTRMNSFTTQEEADRILTNTVAGGPNNNFVESEYGKIVLQRVNNYSAELQKRDLNAIAPQVVPSEDLADAYIKTTYSGSLSKPGISYPNVLRVVQDGTLKAKSRDGTTTEPILTLVKREGITSALDLNGDIQLIQAVGELSGESLAIKNTALGKLSNLPKSDQYFLVAQNLYELNADRMRNAMASNTGISAVTGELPPGAPAHAWRSPGKLAVTGDVTIPGFAGFRIGQIFWIGRTYEHYKQFGAFQLFGITENIDLSNGWTTELHSRFNVIPIDKIRGIQSE